MLADLPIQQNVPFYATTNEALNRDVRGEDGGVGAEKRGVGQQTHVCKPGPSPRA